VPDGEGEHPAQALGERVAPLLVPVDQDFGVAAGAEDVAPGDQLLAQPEVVVDLAVEGDGDGAVLVLHRLRAGLREVDDREPPVPTAAGGAAASPGGTRRRPSGRWPSEVATTARPSASASRTLTESPSAMVGRTNTSQVASSARACGR